MEWDGKGAYDRNTVVGMPHVTKEARTPRDVRMEGKCCACALSSIISVFVLRAPQPRTCCRMEVNKIQFSTLIFAGIPPELAHLDLETLKVTFCALSRGGTDCKNFLGLIFAGIPPELALVDLETLKVTFCALSRGTVDFSVVLFVS